ncbi:LysM domain-containing protein [Microbacterium sp. Marseille-Q6965]|uniref:LysM peptidoglycan-binding domain-containing protein n=1 Tax=Microbacterium sp. Marseille-Q6965 TaxID=2965072 RepID=UPI0021B72570|nr:LysM peptidoglycan-binding domain-containing protein [Microbacterium sp. Marseille-Q6965]
MEAGQTLWAIAQQHGIDVSTLLRANGLSDGAIIYPGQKLRLSMPQPVAAQAQRSATLDAEQTEYARLIIRVGREMGASDRAIATALATAMVESGLRNVDHGDRDSLGLFQQRPSQGWGTPEQVLDPVRATRAFFGGRGAPNGGVPRGLYDIPGWEAMSFGDAAQAVQVSAFPERYGQWEQQSYTWLASLG